MFVAFHGQSRPHMHLVGVKVLQKHPLNKGTSNATERTYSHPL